MNLYTQSIEDPTITLTAMGSDSDEKLLQRRDARVYGIDSPSDTNAKYIEVDYGTATAIDYALLWDLTSSVAIDLIFQYWTGAAYATGQTLGDTYSSENVFITVDPSRNATKYRYYFQESSVPTAFSIDLSHLYMGEAYTFPVNYQYTNSRITQRRTEVLTDMYGYPYGWEINTSKKYVWEVTFRMTKTQVSNLESQMENVGYNVKPFILYDSNIDSNYHLVHFPDNRLTARNLAYEYYEVPMTFVEL